MPAATLRTATAYATLALTVDTEAVITRYPNDANSARRLAVLLAMFADLGYLSAVAVQTGTPVSALVFALSGRGGGSP